MSNVNFNQVVYDSVLNPHSSTSDLDCNIDRCTDFNCSYFDNDLLNSTKIKDCEISLFHLNARSLNKNSNSVVDYIASFDNHFDIYGFTETWFRSNDDSDLVNLDGYIPVNCNRQGRRGGGASLFINSKFNYINRGDLNINCDDCDSVFIEIPLKRGNIIVGIIYKPDYVVFDDFISTLNNTVNSINKEKKRCYIMGDFNLDLLKYDSSREIATFVNMMYSNHFPPCIDKPTRVHVRGPNNITISCIDNIFTNDFLNSVKSGVIVTDLSDHFPTFTITTNDTPNKNMFSSEPAPVRRSRQMQPENINGLKNALSLTDWNSILNENNPDLAYDLLQNKTHSLLNIHCPFKNKKITKRSTPRKPWVTTGLIKSIKTKDKLYRTYLTKPSDENKQKYNKYRNHLNSLLRLAKKSYITSELETNKCNMKGTWRTLNSILGRNKQSKSPDFFKDKDGNKITNLTDIANNFNNFFTNIGSSLASKISPPDTDFTSPLISINITNSIFLKPTTTDEITKITKDLKTSNSTGVDDISTKLLKSIIPEINHVLCHIFNQSLLTGIVPSQLKIAKVTPIFKAGDCHVFSNYRPISILPAISKILEKIMYARLHEFINIQNILTHHQYGFRPKHSTHMAINDLYLKVTKDLDNKLHTVGLFLDLSKAFDTLNHNILLDKLNNYGIRGLANEWIKSYLSGRKQYVCFNQHSSKSTNINCGVPQGSILGPLLFLIYINDLPICSPSSHFIIFADDTNIIFSHDDPIKLERLINTELDNISNWFKLNKLSLNIDKTNFMIFKNKHSNKPGININIKIDNKEINKVTTTKFLGVLIDNNMDWKSHNSHVTKIISKYNGIIRKVRPFLPPNSLQTLYNTFILPYLSYCAIIWADKNNTNLDSLFLVQKKSIRICTNSLWLAHTNPLFYQFQALKVHDIYIHQLSTFMYRHDRSLLPKHISNTLFQSNADCKTHRYDTRQSSDIHIDKTSTNLAKNTITTQGAILWNTMKSDIKNSPSLATFKRKLKTHILDQYALECTTNRYATVS